MESTAHFVENLTLRTWFLSVWPRFVAARLQGRRSIAACYIIDGSPLALLMAKATALPLGITVVKLDFSIAEIKDENGLQVLLRMQYQDLAQVQEYATSEPAFQRAASNSELPHRLSHFLAKNLTAINLFDGNAWRPMILVQVCVWKADQEGDAWTPVLYLERRPWLSSVIRYASQWSVRIIPVSPALNLRIALRRKAPPRLMDLFRAVRYRRYRELLAPLAKRASVESQEGQVDDGAEQSRPRVLAPYYGQLNLDEPHLFSDLFFWQKSSLSAKDILVSFGFPFAPLNKSQRDELFKHGLEPVVLHPGATTDPEMPVFKPHRRSEATSLDKYPIAVPGLEGRWLREEATRFDALREYWFDLFKAYNVKVFLTWYKYDGVHMAIADALQDQGGVTAVYQRAYESNPAPGTAVNTDILFGFAPWVAEVESQAGSSIRYHVTSGYLGDHRFPLLRETARSARASLERNGADRVFAYFDENSRDDPRWFTGHQVIRHDYSFLLEKVLADSRLGVVFKPKDPRTLRRRLGPVADLLSRAESTGRCYVYEGGAIQGSHTPAEAALAADIAIHGHLYAASAGLDAALAGVRTLLLDREGWPVSPLYQLGVGQVVFTDWEGLWEACLHYWASPSGSTAIGDWSPMLDHFDPFRDGRAAERIGTYVQWLLEGFRRGQNREQVMEQAAERYCDLWGRDKVTQVDGRPSDYRLPAPFPNPQVVTST